MAAAVDPEVFKMIQVTPSMAKKAIAVALKAQLMYMLLGSPGIGKSAIVQEVADDFDMLVIDLRLAQCDPTDLNGFPSIDAARQKAGYMPMDTYPLQGETPPTNPKTGQPYQGWILFLDEFNSADKGVQKAAYKLCLDRMVGQFHLHERCLIIGAGNLETDNAIVEEMSSALQSRMIHNELLSCPPEWLQWANRVKLDHRIVSYIEHQPAQLNRFNPSTQVERTYACERTWAHASELLKHMDIHDDVAAPLLAGKISEGVTRDFLNYVAVFKDMPKIPEIIANPNSCPLPDSPGKRFGMSGALASAAIAANVGPLVDYIKRLPMEFQVVTFRYMRLRNPEVTAEPAPAKWLMDHGHELF